MPKSSWGTQTQPYVPATSNWCSWLYPSPSVSLRSPGVPDQVDASGTSSGLTLCPQAAQTHSTVSPTATVTSDGSNRKSPSGATVTRAGPVRVAVSVVAVGVPDGSSVGVEGGSSVGRSVGVSVAPSGESVGVPSSGESVGVPSSGDPRQPASPATPPTPARATNVLRCLSGHCERSGENVGVRLRSNGG